MRHLLFIIMCVLVTGCASTKLSPTEVVQASHTDTLRIVQVQRDSIWLHDSVYVSQYQKGDTVYKEQTKWHTKYIERLSHDTIYAAKVDSIPVPYPVEKRVPADLTWWQEFRLYLADILLWLLSVGAIIAAIRLWKKIRN